MKRWGDRLLWLERRMIAVSGSLVLAGFYAYGLTRTVEFLIKPPLAVLVLCLLGWGVALLWSVCHMLVIVTTLEERGK